MSEYRFRSGTQYTRKDVFAIVGIDDPEGGPWYTGYARLGDDWFIFCGIGTAGRTGHKYENRFSGERLIWSAKPNTRQTQPVMRELSRPKGRVYLFYRQDNRDPFTFAGIGNPIDIHGERPVQITWEVTALPAR
jgi:5-methylcytosine-specific restriction protein A